MLASRASSVTPLIACAGDASADEDEVVHEPEYNAVNAARRCWFRFESVESSYSVHGPRVLLGHVVLVVVFPSTVA
jgi:hypothetical protein